MLQIKWNEQGLVPVIVQDVKSNEILMMAYMNKEAFEKTLKTTSACFYSRSRKKLWTKGESSGHVQKVVEVLTDCDQDTLVIKVEQTGGACHLGYRSCFVHKLNNAGDIAEITQKKMFDPNQVYKSNGHS
ncbi:MAG: phosphoribosyl-AMP cyclohydrolase [Candidatus Omnitrophica bacterium]|nr:phosphoribosyl-AMP cyclohydrolase [Candidatus Omnitrophota bacterium]